MAVTLCRLLVLTLCTYIRCPISLPFLFCMELRRSITEIILLPFSFLPRSQHYTDIGTATPCPHSQQQRPHRVRVVNYYVGKCPGSQRLRVYSILKSNKINVCYFTLIVSFFSFKFFFYFCVSVVVEYAEMVSAILWTVLTSCPHHADTVSAQLTTMETHILKILKTVLTCSCGAQV